jgi:chromosome segregation ATPase
VAKTIEDLEREVQALREEVEELTKREAQREATAAAASKDEEARRTEALLQFAGCFENDPQWAAILEDIERRRKIPFELSEEDVELILQEARRHAMSVGDWLRSLIQSAEARSDISPTQLEREIQALRAEVELLRRHDAAGDKTPDRFAGRFTDDPDWAAIHEAIEARRRIPAGDPESRWGPPPGHAQRRSLQHCLRTRNRELDR